MRLASSAGVNPPSCLLAPPLLLIAAYLPVCEITCYTWLQTMYRETSLWPRDVSVVGGSCSAILARHHDERQLALVQHQPAGCSKLAKRDRAGRQTGTGSWGSGSLVRSSCCMWVLYVWSSRVCGLDGGWMGGVVRGGGRRPGCLCGEPTRYIEQEPGPVRRPCTHARGRMGGMGRMGWRMGGGWMGGWVDGGWADGRWMGGWLDGERMESGHRGQKQHILRSSSDIRLSVC